MLCIVASGMQKGQQDSDERREAAAARLQFSSLILFKSVFFRSFVTVKSTRLTSVNYEYGKISICTVTTYLYHPPCIYYLNTELSICDVLHLGVKLKGKKK